jgi:LysR family transcriptional regulator of beta-lactamase
VCTPAIAARLARPADLARRTLLRSYRADEWTAGSMRPACHARWLRGPVFDSSLTMAAAAVQGAGVALLPPTMFEGDLADGRLVRPFAAEVSTGRYWLTRLKSRRPTPAMRIFREWLLAATSRFSTRSC